MSRLIPEKLTVEFNECTTETSPVIPRRYTLTHSDITAELFLNIGADYAYDKITDMRDEVLGEWLIIEGSVVYYVYLQVGLENARRATTIIRDQIFRRELPLALEAIRYGDRQLFAKYPELDYLPIFVLFINNDVELNKAEYWGTFSDYDITSDPI